MKADVAIVGAGPAGALAACLMARRGARVRLFDPSHPREKACGGGLTARALALVAGIIPEHSLPAVRVLNARFFDGATGSSAVVPLGPSGSVVSPGHGFSADALLIASRVEFDGRLLAAATAAGAELVRLRVTDVRRDRSAFTVHTSDGGVHGASVVVGADGANSLMRRRLARPFRRDQLSIATGFFARGITSDEIVIEFVANPPGYIWSFPRRDHLAIGICAQADAGAASGALRARVAEWLGHAGLAKGAALDAYSWPIPSLSSKDLQPADVAGAGWLLLGDAAGLVDPITREGIFFALESARLAADALASGTRDPAVEYRDRIGDGMVRELRRAARLKASFFRARFLRLLVEGLRHSHALRAVMADIISGAQGYRGLEWRLLRTLEVGLTWKLVRARTDT